MRLYNSIVVPIVLYGAETCAVTILYIADGQVSETRNRQRLQHVKSPCTSSQSLETISSYQRSVYSNYFSILHRLRDILLIV